MERKDELTLLGGNTVYRQDYALSAGLLASAPAVGSPTGSPVLAWGGSWV